MKVLIVYAHPSTNSYTHEMLLHLQATLQKEQIDFEVSDLYAMNFQTDMSEEEYQREGFANLDLSVPDDVLEEQRKIETSDCIIFVYPVWWSDCPAKLKGWFDRVYSVGYAYGYGESNTMKTVKYGLAICTAGHPNEFLKEIGIAESMRNVMIDDRLGQRFDKKEMVILGGTLDKEKVKSLHRQIIESVGKKIVEHCACT